MFSTVAAVASFVHDFESCRLSKAQWTHQAHLVVGFWYLSRHEMPEALDLVRRRIRRHNETVGTPNTDSSGYHAHIARHEEMPFERSLAALLASPLASSDWPLRYYTPQRLFSTEARRTWVEPDLQPPE
jgi:hypothetical protein